MTSRGNDIILGLSTSNNWRLERRGDYSWRHSLEDMANRIPDSFLDAVFYLYPSVEAAEAGEASGGTGFLVHIPVPEFPGKHFVYAVTNRHVINEAEGNSLVMRFNTHDEDFHYVKTQPSSWIKHPDGDDVAVAPASIPQGIKYTAYDLELFVTQEMVKKEDIGPGDEVCLVGRFINHEGRQKNLPSTRFGNIAQMPWEPIEQPTGIMQESYLVEMHSIGGFSGSPVLIYFDGSRPRPNKSEIDFTYRYFLLGVDWGHIQLQEPVIKYDKDKRMWRKHPYKWRVLSNSAMMGVVPAWKILDIINSEEQVMQRKKAVEDLKKVQEKPVTMFSTDAALLNKEEFEDSLKQVSRKIKPSKSDQPKPKT